MARAGGGKAVEAAAAGRYLKTMCFAAFFPAWFIVAAADERPCPPETRYGQQVTAIPCISLITPISEDVGVRVRQAREGRMLCWPGRWVRREAEAGEERLRKEDLDKGKEKELSLLVVKGTMKRRKDWKARFYASLKVDYEGRL